MPQVKVLALVAAVSSWLTATIAACSSQPECEGHGGLCLGSSAAGGVGNAAATTATSLGGDAGASNGGQVSVLGNSGAGGDLRPLIVGSNVDLGGDATFEGLGFPELAAGGTSGTTPMAGAYCDSPAATQEPLDLIVTDHFPGLGWYEDSAAELTLGGSPDRAPDAVGAALGLHWKPIQRAWVGLELQTKNDNWDGPGLCIEPGAAKIRFQARGFRGGERVTFKSAIQDVELPAQRLTTDWQTFEIPLTGVDYDHAAPGGGVRAGLSVVIDDPTLGDQRIYVDDIRWLAAPGSKCTPPLPLQATCAVAPAPALPPAGVAPCDTTTPPSTSLLLDDFEDGDALAEAFANGRAHWEVINDGSSRGVQYPAPCVMPTERAGATSKNRWSMRTYGCGFGIFGAGLRLTFDHDPPDCLPPFQAYTGMEFAIDTPTALPIVVVIWTASNTPIEQGGSCAADCTPLFDVVQVSAGSRRYQVDFADFGRFFDPASIVSINWMVPPGVSTFDFGLDDVGFYQ